MAAYHNPDWAECYDLWVRFLFGDGPVEDISIFENILQDVVATKVPGSKCSIIDVGTGSGRVLIDLQTAMQRTQDLKFEVWGTEPSRPMLDRAKRFWNEAVERKRAEGSKENVWEEEKIEIHWSQCGATNFADDVWEHLGQGADLIIFAAGGFSHIIHDKDVKMFFEEISEVFATGGKAIISILRDYLPDEGDRTFASSGRTVETQDDATTEFLKQPQRIASKDHTDLVYIKYPPVETRNGDVKTETFKLDVESADGQTVLRTHELNWETRVFNAPKMLEMIYKAELKVSEVIEGKFQVWWILEKR